MVKISNQKLRRSIRTRSKLNPSGKLRLSVFRSCKSVFVQIIDDQKKKTLLTAGEKDIKTDIKTKKSEKAKLTKTEKAKLIGEVISQKAVKAGIKEVVFDKGSFQYHGRIKALAEEARKGGLKF